MSLQLPLSPSPQLPDQGHPSVSRQVLVVTIPPDSAQAVCAPQRCSVTRPSLDQLGRDLTGQPNWITVADEHTII